MTSQASRRAAGLAFVVAIAASIAVTGCEQEECETNRDCPSGLFQCVDNECVLPEVPPLVDVGEIPQVDIGPRPDLGPIDLGFRPDLGFLPRRDLGLWPDAMPDSGLLPDGGDAGAADADAGFPGAPTDTEALVVVGFIQTFADGGTELADARFIDYTQSGRRLVRRMQEGCTVTERGPGTGVGLTATRIEIANGPQLILRPTISNPGLFENQTQVNPRQLIDQGNTVSYEIVSSGALGTLGNVTTTTGLPVSIMSSVLPDPRVEIGYNVINLVLPATQGANRLEIYDQSRTVVVECPVTPATTGLPASIASLYPSQARVSLEVRSDAERIVSVPVLGRGSIPVTFRATRGVRYTLVIP